MQPVSEISEKKSELAGNVKAAYAVMYIPDHWVASKDYMLRANVTAGEFPHSSKALSFSLSYTHVHTPNPKLHLCEAFPFMCVLLYCSTLGLTVTLFSKTEFL